jgi:hypothetical protein
MRKILAFMAVGLLSLAFAGSAFGASATEDAYSGTAGVQEFDQSESGTAATEEETSVAATSESDSSSGGSLPFTGLDVGLIALAGVALVGMGLLVRRSTRRDEGAGA